MYTVDYNYRPRFSMSSTTSGSDLYGYSWGMPTDDGYEIYDSDGTKVKVRTIRGLHILPTKEENPIVLV